MSEERQVPLPWNPNEECQLNDKPVDTRLELHPSEELDGVLFKRICEGLDNSLPRRKDNFVDCIKLLDVPLAKLLLKNFPPVPFPGAHPLEIPKTLLARMLPCCLKDRAPGFDLDVEQELDEEDKKKKMEDVFEATTTVIIQLGLCGTLILAFDIKPEMCFCDEECGDEDYIDIKVNMGAEFEYGDCDPIKIRRIIKIIRERYNSNITLEQYKELLRELGLELEHEPDLLIPDDVLEDFISAYGGGGDGRSECTQKVFAYYYRGHGYLPMNSPLDLNDFIQAEKAPYLTKLNLVDGNIYKLEYFCEYEKWYVTDGDCEETTRNILPVHFVQMEEYSRYNAVSADSTLSESEAFVQAPTFSYSNGKIHLTDVYLQPASRGVVVYNLMLKHIDSNSNYTAKVAITVTGKLIPLRLIIDNLELQYGSQIHLPSININFGHDDDAHQAALDAVHLEYKWMNANGEEISASEVVEPGTYMVEVSLAGPHSEHYYIDAEQPITFRIVQ